MAVAVKHQMILGHCRLQQFRQIQVQDRNCIGIKSDLRTGFAGYRTTAVESYTTAGR